MKDPAARRHRRISDLPNLGPWTEKILAEIGLRNASDLDARGAVAAYVQLKFLFGRQISLNGLYAMEAARRECDWRALPPRRSKG